MLCVICCAIWGVWCVMFGMCCVLQDVRMVCVCVGVCVYAYACVYARGNTKGMYY